MYKVLNSIFIIFIIYLTVHFLKKLHGGNLFFMPKIKWETLNDLHFVTLCIPACFLTHTKKHTII